MKENIIESITQEELEKIRGYTRKDIPPEELYTFSLILCDNEIDRDGEKFPGEALDKLAALFEGKTGIFDHNMSSRGQSARIYEAHVEKDASRRTRDGEIYTFIKAKAYMVRTEKNKDLISEIDAGIKKETSVGCSVKSIRCSVCGKDVREEGCEHRKGEIYAGKTCCLLLCEPEDAYEWSFVAVPAQRSAGVVKAYKGGSDEKDWAEEFRREMQAEVIRSFSKLMPTLKSELLSDICSSLKLKDLRELRNALSIEEGKLMPLSKQLDIKGEKAPDRNDNYKI